MGSLTVLTVTVNTGSPEASTCSTPRGRSAPRRIRTPMKKPVYGDLAPVEYAAMNKRSEENVTRHQAAQPEVDEAKRQHQVATSGQPAPGNAGIRMLPLVLGHSDCD